MIGFLASLKYSIHALDIYWLCNFMCSCNIIGSAQVPVENTRMWHESTDWRQSLD